MSCYSLLYMVSTIIINFVFFPLAIASYRLMPQIKLHEEIVGDRAKTLAKIFPGVVKVSKKKGKYIYVYIIYIKNNYHLFISTLKYFFYYYSSENFIILHLVS